MSSKFLQDPLVSVPDEVVLDNPPLKLALAQISFPTMLSISQPNSPQVVAFQESVRDDYPDYEALNDAPNSLYHVFKSQDGWEIALNSDTLVFSTTQYTIKDEFVSRFCKVADTAKKSFNINQEIGLGVRFIDRVEDEEVLKNLEKYINPAFLNSFPNIDPSAILASEKKLYLALPNQVLLNLRWGMVPPNQNLSNMYISPYPQYSWVLCSDIHTAKRVKKFDLNEIASTTKNFSERRYAMFRHVFNDNFILSCGGKI